MTGKIDGITARGGGRLVASVTLDKDQVARLIEFDATLVEQWTPAAVQAYLLHQAQLAYEQDFAASVQLGLHQALLVGTGTAAPVCHRGEIGCTDPHPAAGCGRACTEDHAHRYDPALDQL